MLTRRAKAYSNSGSVV